MTKSDSAAELDHSLQNSWNGFKDQQQPSLSDAYRLLGNPWESVTIPRREGFSGLSQQQSATTEN